jgi:tetratricopeptide (TPR) repeat protein
MVLSSVANVPHPVVIQQMFEVFTIEMLSGSRGFVCPYTDEGFENQSDSRVATAAESICESSGIVLAVEDSLGLMIVDALVLQIAADESSPVTDFEGLCELLLSRGQRIASVRIDPGSGEVTIVESVQGEYSFDPELSSGAMVAKGRELMMDRADYVGALTCFEQACEKDPKNADAWFNKAQALQYLGRSREAAACFGRSLELSPRAADMLSGAGESPSESEQPAEEKDELSDELAQKLRDLEEVNAMLDQSGIIQQASQDMTGGEDEGKKKRWWR